MQDIEQQSSTISEQEFLAAHEDIFRSGQAMRVDETSQEYSARVQSAWEQRRAHLLMEREALRKAPEKPAVHPEVARWLGHPLTESYARCLLAGESLNELLVGQQQSAGKREAIEMLAEALRASVGVGKDEVVDGKNLSYSQILARQIAEAVRGKHATR